MSLRHLRRVASSALALALAACSGAFGSPDPAPAPGQSPDTPDVPTPVASGSPDASVRPPAPVDPLPADPRVACPGAYKVQKPAEGLNTSFEVAGQSREFVLLLPPASFTGPRPLFVAFHGTSESGPRFVTRAKLAEIAARGFVVVAPTAAYNGAFWPIWDAMRAPGTEAQPNKDLDLFDTLVACTAAHFTIDRSRIFVGGHSAGGIFTNKVLRARSSLVAGGIVGSGVFDLTGSGSSAPLGDMFVLVTWGGDNDVYRGTTPTGVNVPEFSFVEQASLASRHYEAQAAVQQVACKGADLGHAWLPMNAWFADAMIAHPKGGPKAPLAPVPVGTPASCSEAAYLAPPLPSIACSGTPTGCQAACQLMADCVAENRTVGTVMKGQLTAFGFSGTSCGGCITRCQQAGTSAANTAVLGCFQQQQQQAQCGAGIEGASPFMKAVDVCCKNRKDSSFCVSVCSQIVQNEAASPFFPACPALVN